MISKDIRELCVFFIEFIYSYYCMRIYKSKQINFYNGYMRTRKPNVDNKTDRENNNNKKKNRSVNLVIILENKKTFLNINIFYFIFIM